MGYEGRDSQKGESAEDVEGAVKARKWNQPACLSGELSKENRMCTHSVILLSFFVTWIELESVVTPGGISRAQKDSHYIFSCRQGS